MMYLCTMIGDPESVLIEDFEIHDDRIAFVTLPLYSLRHELLHCEENENPVDIERMMRDVLRDVNYLTEKMKISHVDVSLKSIYKVSEKDGFAVGDWASKTPFGERINSLDSLPENEAPVKVTNAEEVYNLGLVVLETFGCKYHDIEDLVEINDIESYKKTLEDMIARLECSELTKISVRKMLEKDVGTRARVTELMEDLHQLDKVVKVKAIESRSIEVQTDSAYEKDEYNLNSRGHSPDVEQAKSLAEGLMDVAVQGLQSAVLSEGYLENRIVEEESETFFSADQTGIFPKTLESPAKEANGIRRPARRGETLKSSSLLLSPSNQSYSIPQIVVRSDLLDPNISVDLRPQDTRAAGPKRNTVAFTKLNLSFQNTPYSMHSFTPQHYGTEERKGFLEATPGSFTQDGTPMYVSSFFDERFEPEEDSKSFIGVSFIDFLRNFT